MHTHVLLSGAAPTSHPHLPTRVNMTGFKNPTRETRLSMLSSNSHAFCSTFSCTKTDRYDHILALHKPFYGFPGASRIVHDFPLPAVCHVFTLQFAFLESPPMRGFLVA